MLYQDNHLSDMLDLIQIRLQELFTALYLSVLLKI
jgi:hypothetical protein